MSIVFDRSGEIQNENLAFKDRCGSRETTLISSLFAWDCLPFCLFDASYFLPYSDQTRERNRSPALECAMLALASSLEELEEGGSGVGLRGAYAYDFFSNAASILGRQHLITDIDDIQAFGVLAMAQAVSGKLDDAQILAERYLSGVSQLFLSDEPEQYDDDSRKIRNSAFCGAVSLLRCVHLLWT